MFSILNLVNPMWSTSANGDSNGNAATAAANKKKRQSLETLSSSSSSTLSSTSSNSHLTLSSSSSTSSSPSKSHNIVANHQNANRATHNNNAQPPAEEYLWNDLWQFQDIIDNIPERIQTKRSPNCVDPTDPALFDEKYVLGSIIGEGGFGSVHHGHRKIDELPVAVKIIKRKRVIRFEEKNGMPLEVALLKSLAKVPNVIRLLDW